MEIESPRIAYELKNKVLDVHKAIREEEYEAFDNKSKEFMDYFQSKKTKNYLLGFGKLTIGVGNIKRNPAWLEWFVETMHRLDKCALGINQEIINRIFNRKDSESVKKLEYDLLMLGNALSIMDIQEEEINQAYANA